ncbi:MAG TPA: hypothetical protein VK436_10040 [Methanocella sp.]|nr:hypothetical protein [Methanocella sp.]
MLIEMLPSWLAILMVLAFIGADLLLISAIAVIVALFIGFLGVSAFRGYIEGLINELIRDILAELQGYITTKQGKAADYTSAGLGLARKIYSLIYGCYNLFHTALLILVMLGVGMIVIALLAVLATINTMLVYIVAYIL